MAKHILHAVDGRETHLHPLHARKNELIAKQTALAHQGEHLSAREKSELTGLINQIKVIQAPPSAAASGTDYSVGCYGIGRKCSARVDVMHEKNVIADIHSVRIFDPNAEPNDRNVWVYPPNLGTLVLCVGCWSKLQLRFDEQRVEIEA